MSNKPWYQSWWPTISLILGGVVTAVTPPVQNVLGHHPILTSFLATILAVAAHLLPSPVQPVVQ